MGSIYELSYHIEPSSPSTGGDQASFSPAVTPTARMDDNTTVHNGSNATDDNTTAVELTSITINGHPTDATLTIGSATNSTANGTPSSSLMPPLSPNVGLSPTSPNVPNLTTPNGTSTSISSFGRAKPNEVELTPLLASSSASSPIQVPSSPNPTLGSLMRTTSVYALPTAPPPTQSMDASLPHDRTLAVRPSSSPPEGPAAIPKSRYDTAREAGTAWIAAHMSNEHTMERRAEDAYIFARQHLWEHFWDNLFAEYYRDTLHIRHRDNGVTASHIGLKAYEDGVKYLMAGDTTKMKIVDCCMTMLAGPDVYWDGGVEHKPTQVTAEDGSIVEQHRRLQQNTAPEHNKFGALEVQPFPFRATFTYDVTGEQVIFSWLTDVDGVKRDGDEGMLQLKQLIALNLTTRKVERLRRERRALRAIDQLPINIIPYWGHFRMLKPWSQLIRHPVDGERLDIGAGFDYELQSVRYIEELPAACCLFAARRAPPAELKSKDLAKHLAALVVDTVSEEDLKKVNDRYDSWRLYEAKRFDAARRQLSHSFYPFVYLDASLTLSELQKRIVSMEGGKHMLVTDLFTPGGKHRAKVDLFYKRHRMFASSLAAPFWFQVFNSMWHALRPFKSELHSVADDIRTAAITDWYAIRDAGGRPVEKTPRVAPHPLDPENHTGLCFLPMDRIELEKRLEQLGLWPTVNEFLTPTFLQHFYTLLDQLIVASMAATDKASAMMAINEQDKKRAADDNKYTAVTKSKKKDAPILPSDDDNNDTAHYDEVIKPSDDMKRDARHGKKDERVRPVRVVQPKEESFWFRFMSCGPVPSEPHRDASSSSSSSSSRSRVPPARVRATVAAAAIPATPPTAKAVKQTPVPIDDHRDNDAVSRNDNAAEEEEEEPNEDAYDIQDGIASAITQIMV